MSRLFGFFLVLLAVLPVWAQQTVAVHVPVREALSRREFDFQKYSVKFEVFNEGDSVPFARSSTGMNGTASGRITFTRPEVMLRVFVVNRETESEEDYEGAWVSVALSQADGGNIMVNPVYLNVQRKKKLNEVAVTASRVKVYYKGDTLIYNADAFVLPSGSSLDALLQQMPGVELRRDGVIYCNGRRVNDLLLNGKDLFNGNKELMLKNLGAYIVKDIAVYDKTGRLSELFGQNMGDDSYVMDVRLKRDYHNGYILNAEAGYGTHDRYLGKLFGMWFSDNVSMTMYGGLNNLSDESTPGKADGAWSRSKMGTGVRTRHNAGLTYIAQGTGSKWEMKGSADVTRSVVNDVSTVSRQNFLSSGDTYNYSFTTGTRRTTAVKTDHHLFAKIGNRANFNFTPKFAYDKIDNDSRRVDAALDNQLADASRSRLENIYFNGIDAADGIRILNRSMNESVNTGHTMQASADAAADIKLSQKHAALLTLRAQFSTDQSHQDMHYHYGIRFEDNASGIDQNRHTQNYPNENYNYSAGAEFSKRFQVGRHTIPFVATYWYSHGRHSHASDLYVIDSEKEIFSPLDSYHSFEISTSQSMTISMRNASFKHHGVDYRVFASLPVRYLSRQIRYDGRGVAETLHRNDPIVNGSASLAISPGWTSWNIEFRGSTQVREVDMLRLIDVSNSTDPLNLYKGNPNLRNTRENSFGVYFRILDIPKNRFSHIFSIDGAVINDATVYGYSYNPVNGVKTHSYYNVDGNWRTEGRYKYTQTLRHGLSLNNELRGGYHRNTDMVGTSAEPIRRYINTVNAGNAVELNWQTGRNRFTIKGDALMDRYRSADAGFRNFTSWVYSCGGSAQFMLPHNWDLGTDISLYGRCGFVDSRLNTTEVVWNARVSKSILKGALTFTLDAYDLLRQLNNITYTVNAQARTETVSNVIPSYLLFHIQYRFSHNPKR